jgi:hypothetical protein
VPSRLPRPVAALPLPRLARGPPASRVGVEPASTSCRRLHRGDRRLGRAPGGRGRDRHRSHRLPVELFLTPNLGRRKAAREAGPKARRSNSVVTVIYQWRGSYPLRGSLRDFRDRASSVPVSPPRVSTESRQRAFRKVCSCVPNRAHYCFWKRAFFSTPAASVGALQVKSGWILSMSLTSPCTCA